MPYRAYGQHLEYLWLAPSVASWEKAYLNGECNEIQSIFWNAKTVEELYDTENDPWEINNLANNSEYSEILERMRAANKAWLTRIYDTGFIPEADRVDRVGETPVYDYMRSGKINFEEIIQAAEIATLGKVENIETLKTYLKNNESAVRYWGATGFLILGEKAKPAIGELKLLLEDNSAIVASVAAEALYNLGEKEIAKKALLKVLENPNEMARCYALNVIDCIGENSAEIKQGVVAVVKNTEKLSREQYDLRSAKWLFQKWQVNPSEYQIEFSW
jgi:hypothetical protein